MRLTPERDKEIREWAEACLHHGEQDNIRELLSEIDALRADVEAHKHAAREANLRTYDGLVQERDRLREAIDGMVKPLTELSLCHNCMGENHVIVKRVYDAAKQYVAQAAEPQEPKYPCDKCGKIRTKAEGGTTFTVCDECWANSAVSQEDK